MNKFARVNNELNALYDMYSTYELVAARDIKKPILINRFLEVPTKEGIKLAGCSDSEQKYFFAPSSLIKIVNELLAEDENATIENLIEEPFMIRFEKVEQASDSKKSYIKTIIC